MEVQVYYQRKQICNSERFEANAVAPTATTSATILSCRVCTSSFDLSISYHR
jgi:hypothetical protein